MDWLIENWFLVLATAVILLVAGVLIRARMKKRPGNKQTTQGCGAQSSGRGPCHSWGQDEEAAKRLLTKRGT